MTPTTKHRTDRLVRSVPVASSVKALLLSCSHLLTLFWCLAWIFFLAAATPADSAETWRKLSAQQANTEDPQGAIYLAEAEFEKRRTSSPSVASHRDVRPGFVYQIDGTFYVNAAPIRFWGVNMGWGGPWKQGGDAHKSLTHDDLDHIVARLKALGFNAVRIFPPSSFFFGNLRNGRDSDYTKGDSSLVDKFDYFLYRLKQEGMYAYMSLNLFGPSSVEMDPLFQGPADEFEAWKTASEQYGWPNVIDKAFFVDKTWQRIKIQNILRVLRHYNKWTGKHYYEDEVFALYELNNEVRFPERILSGELGKRLTGKKSSGMPEYFERQFQEYWNIYLVRKYGDDSKLPAGYLKAGESLSDGSVGLAPARGDEGYIAARGRDFAQFVLAHCDSIYDKLFAEIRASAPSGVGANVAPINVDSISGSGENIANAFVTARGGFNAGNGYQHHHYTLRADSRHPYHPYVSMLSLPPEPHDVSKDEYHQKNPNMAIGRIRGQPFVMYEGMTMTPNIFKAEYFIEQAVLGSWQNHGGYFFYSYSIRALADDLMWYRGPLMYSSENEWGTSGGFTRDEVMLSTAWAAGAAFRNFSISSAPKPTMFVFGGDSIFNPDWQGHGAGKDDWQRTARTAIKYGAELDFEPESSFEKRIVGPVQESDFTEAVVPENGEIVWDWPNRRLVVDTPRAKIYAGVFPTDRRYTFRDGVMIENVNRPWGFFVLASDTNESIAASSRIFMSLVQTSDNSGFEIDPERLSADHRTHLGWKNATVSIGSLPVIVNRMSADVTLPYRPGRILIKRDFDLKQIGPVEDASSKIRLSADEPVFQWILLDGKNLEQKQ